MTVMIDGQIYYRTAEVFRMIGISRNTLYRWLRKDILGGIEHRDSRGWRLFTSEEIDKLNTAINRISRVDRGVAVRHQAAAPRRRRPYPTDHPRTRSQDAQHASGEFGRRGKEGCRKASYRGFGAHETFAQGTRMDSSQGHAQGARASVPIGF